MTLSSAPVAFLIDRKQFVLGNGDLTLSADLRSGTSSLEGLFGIGLAPGGSEAGSFLAGMPAFDVDLVEVFSVA